MKQSYPSHEASSRAQALVILGLLLFCIPLIFSGFRQARFDGRSQARQASAVAAFPGDDVLITTWQGSRLGDPRIEEFRQKLLGTVAADGLVRGGSPLVVSVETPDDLLNAMRSDDITTEQAVQQLSGLWLGKGGLKLKATAVGRRDLEWTANRISMALNAVEGRKVVVSVAQETAPVNGAEPVHSIDAYDFEVFCTAAHDPNAVPADLKEEVLQARGYPTANEPDGQKLVESAFVATGTPVALRVRMSEAGRAEPEAAAGAIRVAAKACGIAEQDLLITGTLLESAGRANALREAAWRNLSSLPGGISSSPIAAIVIISAVVGVAVGGWSRSLMVVFAAAGYGAAAFAAGINLLGIAWTDSLLLMPAVVFALTVVLSLMDPPGNVRISVRMRQSMSSASLLCLVSVGILLASANLGLESDRVTAIAGCVACSLAWGLAILAVPALNSLFGNHLPVRQSSVWGDFADWIVAHPRMTGATVSVVGASIAVILLLPPVKSWVAVEREVSSDAPQFHIERALTGSGELEARIVFSAENVQRMRFLERANIVRAVTERLRNCAGVTGAMSLAELAPIVPVPEAGAKPRERNAYVVRSSRVEEQMLSRNETMGNSWLVTGKEDELAGESWKVQAAVSSLSSVPKSEILRQINSSIQDVLKYHAGVSHHLAGELVIASTGRLAVQHQWMQLGAVISLVFFAGVISARSLWNAILLASLASTPAFLILSLPQFRPEQLGIVGALLTGVSIACGLLASVRLTNDYREWLPASATRSEALAFALSASIGRSRQVLFVLMALYAGLSIATPSLAPGAVRAGVWATGWAIAVSQVLMPLLLAGRFGDWLSRDDSSRRDLAESIRMAPIHPDRDTDGQPESYELDVRPRVRNAG